MKEIAKNKSFLNFETFLDFRIHNVNV